MNLKRRLELLGYLVPGIANNAESALFETERCRPNLILMDIRLQGETDGIETARRIRAKFSIPIIFVTAHADEETLERAKITEPFGYIVKPFIGVDFRAQIETVLWKHAMEVRLRTSEARLAATLRNAGDAIVTSDGDGRIVSMNPAAEKLTGRTASDGVGMRLGDLARFREEASGRQLPLEYAADGERVICRSGNTPLEIVVSYVEGDRAMGSVIVMRDVSERLKAEERDRQIQKMRALSLLSTGVARELKESLGHIDVDVEELLTTAHGLRRKLLRDVLGSSNRARALAEQLTMMGRTEAGNPAPLDANELISGLAPRLGKYFGRKRFLETALEPDLPRIRADREDLTQCLTNLVLDARESIPSGGKVEIRTELRDGSGGKPEVLLIIRDSGKAISSGASRHVFDPYYQSRPGKRNSGLLLALVHHFVTLNNGRIEVETSDENGTAFAIGFPAAEDSLWAGAAAEEAECIPL